jgi:hypothetical protein
VVGHALKHPFQLPSDHQVHIGYNHEK